MKKIIVAMSGGIDSTIACWLLKKEKYYIEAIYMKNWEEDDSNIYCNSYIDLKDVKNICDTLKIKLNIVNFSYEYWQKVFKFFINDYKKGLTPNPDILCNKEIKFKILLNYVIKNLKFDLMATGHYARKFLYKNRYCLLKSIDNLKDQTYFLYNLKHKQLSKIIFPLGNFTKIKVRKIANKLKFINSNKKSSVGICFIGKKKFSNFISRFIKNKIGNIVNKNNIILGKHKGIFYYTIGQRIPINNNNKSINKNKLPWYVISKNYKKNLLIIEYGHHNKYLLSKGIIIKKIIWNNDIYKNILFNNKLFCYSKIRHTYKMIKTKLVLNKKIKVLFLEKVYSIAIGQSIVLYYNNICLGGGIISKNLLFYPIKI